jgi:hypothetical protein
MQAFSYDVLYRLNRKRSALSLEPPAGRALSAIGYVHCRKLMAAAER